MNSQTLKYLQKDEIGKVIANGLATIYLNKPEKPIRYLAEWLKTYSKNEKQMGQVIKQQQLKKQKANEYLQSNNAKEMEVKKRKKQGQQEQHKKQQFRQMIAQHQYHEELLEQIIAQFLQKNTKATGVYIGEFNYPQKSIADQDIDEQAHLNTTADKVITYIGSSISHKALMRGKLLNPNQGITVSAFKLLEEASVSAVGEDGQEILQPPKPKYIYVPNVVKNQMMHYFKIPKLGSYLAIPIKCNQYLTQQNFDAKLAAKLTYLKQQEEFQKTKNEQLDELHKQKQELQKKIHDLKQKNVDTAHLQPVQTQLKQVNEAIAEKQKEKVQQKIPQLVASTKYYVICADTLGKDQQLSVQEIELMNNIAELFKTSWQKKQQELLTKDINNQVSILKSLGNLPETAEQTLKNSSKPNQEQLKQLNAIPQEHARNHKQLQLQLSKLATEILQNQAYLQSFVKLKQLRVVKYQSLIQNILYFLRHTKKEINSFNRTTLNWKLVKDKFITPLTFRKVFQYNPIGPKNQQYTFYSKTPYLSEQFQKYSNEEIFKYNVALGALTLFIKKALELRELDVELREEKHESHQKQIQKIEQQNQKIVVKMKQQLQKHRSALTSDEIENFNEDQWIKNYHLEHPLHEVPNLDKKDINNDM